MLSCWSTQFGTIRFVKSSSRLADLDQSLNNVIGLSCLLSFAEYAQPARIWKVYLGQWLKLSAIHAWGSTRTVQLCTHNKNRDHRVKARATAQNPKYWTASQGLPLQFLNYLSRQSIEKKFNSRRSLWGCFRRWASSNSIVVERFHWLYSECTLVGITTFIISFQCRASSRSSIA